MRRWSRAIRYVKGTIHDSWVWGEASLAFDVYFWAKAWKSTDVGIWPELSPTRLAFLEYLLIGVASTAFGLPCVTRLARRGRSNGHCGRCIHCSERDCSGRSRTQIFFEG